MMCSRRRGVWASRKGADGSRMWAGSTRTSTWTRSFARMRTRGVLFAIAVLPLHTLYYLNNGFAVLYGWALHHLFGDPMPDATTQAYAEVGLDMWPPVPSKKPDTGGQQR